MGRYDPTTRGGALANLLASLVGDLGPLPSSPKPRHRGGKLACDSCGKSPPKLLSCGRCNSSFYCGVACQKIHWRQAHWRVCKKHLCEARVREVMTRVGVHRRELVEASLEITGQRVEAACAVASAVLGGTLEPLDDDELIAAFKLVFGTNVKPKHLKYLGRDPSDASVMCHQIYDTLEMRLDGLGCVLDVRTHDSVRDLLRFVYASREVGAFLALADELLTPPFRLEAKCASLDSIRRRVEAAWAHHARSSRPDEELGRETDEHCATLARRDQRARSHGAHGRPAAWLQIRGHWLPKEAAKTLDDVCFEDGRRSPCRRRAAPARQLGLPALPENDILC